MTTFNFKLLCLNLKFLNSSKVFIYLNQKKAACTMSAKLKALYVGKLNQQTNTYTFCRQKNKQIKDDLEKMPGKIIVLNAKPDQRNKLKTSYGAWYVTQSNGWGYAVGCGTEYPQRHAYGLVDKIKQIVQNKDNKQDIKSMKQVRKQIQEQFNKYSNLQNVDKVHKAQTQVNMLENDLQTGVRKLINNQQNLQELQGHAEQMKGFAKQFQKKSATVESITFWHKWKFIMIIVLVLLGMLALVAVSIMVKYKF